MNNNWVFDSGSFDWDYVDLPDELDCDDGYDDGKSVSIGDELEAGHSRQHGVVIGIINNKYGQPTCYKVFYEVCTLSDNDEIVKIGEGLDYIQASDVTLHEMCGDAKWSLGRIGYTWFDEETDYYGGYFKNDKTGDVIYW